MSVRTALVPGTPTPIRSVPKLIERPEYVWKPTAPTRGVLFLDTPVGRQGPIYITLNTPQKMTWQFGTESMTLMR